MTDSDWETARAIRVDGDVFTQDSEGWWLDANMEDSVGDRVLEGRDITVIIDAEGRNVEAGAVELGYQISESKLLDEARRELAEEKAGRLTWQERAEELDAALTAAQARAGEAEAEVRSLRDELDATRDHGTKAAHDRSEAWADMDRCAEERAAEDHRLDQAAAFLAETMPRIAIPENGETYENAGRYLRRILSNIRADRS